MQFRSGFRLLAPMLACSGLIAATAVVAGSGTWTSNGPYGGNVRRVVSWEQSPTTLWSIGGGGVFRSLSGGSSWARISTGLPDGAFPTDLAASTTLSPVLFLTTGSQLFRSGNGGDLWVATTMPCAATFLGDIALRRGSTTEIAVMIDDGVCVSSTGGASWLPAFTPGSGFYPSSVDYSDTGTIYVSGNDNSGAKIFKSSDGVSWTATATPGGGITIGSVMVAPGNANRLYATIYNQLATSADAGATWSPVELPVSCQLPSFSARNRSMAIANSNEGALWLGCREGVIKTSDATVAFPAWTYLAASSGLTTNATDSVWITTLAIHSAYPITPSVWVGTQDAGLFASSNDGVAWAPINQNFASMNIRSLATHPSDKTDSVVLAGQGDTGSPSWPLWKSPDGAASWAHSTSGLNAEQLRAISIDPTTTDDIPLTSDAFTVYGVGRSENFTTPRDGGIYKSTNAGASWSTIDNGLPPDSVAPFQPYMGTVRAVALDPRSCTAPPPSGPCVFPNGPLQTLYVGGSGRVNVNTGVYAAARIYKSSNAGGTWTASDDGMPAPQNLGPVGAPYYAYQGGIVQIVIDPVTPTTLYASSFLAWNGDGFGVDEPTVPNGVFKSTNGGASWVHSSVGLPALRGAGSSQYDVLALAIDPAHPQVLYAGASNVYPMSGARAGSVYKTINGGASWAEVGAGISGEDVRALVLDPTDPSGNTVYAGTGGSTASPGGVFRTTDGGVTWNSFSLGLGSYSTTSLALPPREVGVGTRILAGTRSGVSEYTFVPDEDADGVPTSIENAIGFTGVSTSIANGVASTGDGNGDGIPDATQPDVASLFGFASTGIADAPQPNPPPPVSLTVSIVSAPGSCSQLNDVTIRQASLYPPDPIGAPASLVPNGLVSLALPNCTAAKLRVKYNFAFDSNWHWRNYGPRIPGDDGSFGWYSFAGAIRISADTWELDIDASRQGNYRNDDNNILFVGGPSRLPDLIFDHGFE